MTKGQLARCEMLERVRNFGQAHREQFPDASIGGQAFASVAAAVQQLSQFAVAKMSTARDGRRGKHMARTALRDRLDAIARTARVIARTHPGFDDPFRLPQQQTDSVLLTTGRVFVQDAEPLAPEFIAHGLPETFIADVKDRIGQLERAVHQRQVARSERTAAQTATAAALSNGMAAVRTLDLIVANRFRDDPVTLAVWEGDRRLNVGRRSKVVAAAAASTTTAAPPAAAPLAPPAEQPASPTTAAGPAQPASSAPIAEPLRIAEKASGVAS